MALKFAVNNSLSDVTSLPTAIPTGSMTLLQTQTASSSATIDFTSNIDSTYKAYVFKFIDIHPANNSVEIEFQGSTNGGSSYGVTMTTTNFQASHNEDDSATNLAYITSGDLAQSTSYQRLARAVGNDNDQNCAGTFTIYNPSSTTFVKHFISDFNENKGTDGSIRTFTAGYFNTTNAINALDFKASSGNIDSGVIKLYGIS